MKTQAHKFHVIGMHCKACVLLTESELSEVPGVTSARADLATRSVDVSGDFGGRSPEQVAEALSVPLAAHGYSLAVAAPEEPARWGEFKLAVPLALAFAAAFVALQKLGIVNLVDATSVSYGTAFAVGIVASLSTCMAVVGGLVLSMSATFAKRGGRARPQVLFHVSRLAAFFVLGGVIGAIGSAFTLSTSATFVLSVAVGSIMLVLGINLLDVFPWAKKLQPAMPAFLARRAHGTSKLTSGLTPALVGVATFFLPCGFTQAMQVYTLTTGSFTSGGLTMLAFALGTLPVLALVSFSSLSLREGAWSGVFFKTAGLVVIAFAVFNLLSSLVVLGWLPPLFNF